MRGVFRSSFFMFLLVVLVVSFSVPAYAASAGDSPGMFDSALEWAKGVFIPDKDYFPNQLQRFNDLIKLKLGGVADLYKTLEFLFTGLTKNISSTALVFTLPDNYFFRGFEGFSVDILSHGAIYIKLLRDIFSVFMFGLTSMACYKKLVVFFDS